MILSVFMKLILVIARSALVLRDEAISNIITGDCFGRKSIALAPLAPHASAGVTN
jgi:hypothetical protein